MQEINNAAEWYFRCNCAETMVVNAADYDIDDDGGYYEMSSEDSDESEESDYEAYCKKRREKAHARKEKEKRKTARAELQTGHCGTQHTMRCCILHPLH
jgi:hypothetical protein